MEYRASDIASFVGGEIEGDGGVLVNWFSPIESSRPGTLTFLSNPKYEPYIYTTRASVVLVNKDFIPSSPVAATLIRVPDAYVALASLLSLVNSLRPVKIGISAKAHMAESAVIGEGCYVGEFAYIGAKTVIGARCLIYPHAYIGDNVTIGDGTIIYPHVTVYDGSVIGQRCILQAGSVIGSDGFGYALESDGSYKKIPQLGNVILEDDVEVGANTTIDRAVIDSTIIRHGVKLDNLIQIAHNVEVGHDTVMASQVGIAGSTKVGSNCSLGGQAGLSGHINIGSRTQIGAQSGIMRDLSEGSAVLGSPAMPVREYFRSAALFNKFSEIYQTLNRLERELGVLRGSQNKSK